MKILAAQRGDAANYYRLQAPFMVLKQQGVDVAIKRPSLDDVKSYDLLWLQMHAEPLSDIVLHAFQDAGKPVVYDVDDWVFELPPSWYSYDHYFQRGTGLPTERMHFHKRALAAADVVTCTTEYLRDKLTEQLPSTNIQVLPNCILMGDWDVLPEAAHGQDGPVLGWFGTGNHWDDWREIVDAVDEALATVKGYLALMGAPELLPGFPKRLQARTLVTELTPMAQFHTIRPLIKACDVGLAWATDTLEISRCRSPLKIFQWGAAGVPFVASSTVYGPVAREYCYLSTVRPAALYGRLVETLTLADFPRQSVVAQWQQAVWTAHSYETQSWRWLKVAEELC